MVAPVARAAAQAGAALVAFASFRLRGAIGVAAILALAPWYMCMLVLTLALSMLTFASGRANALLGAVHLLLFLAYLVLIVER